MVSVIFYELVPNIFWFQLLISADFLWNLETVDEIFFSFGQLNKTFTDVTLDSGEDFSLINKSIDNEIIASCSSTDHGQRR